MINSNKKYGFTLMELMVAVIIIAVLAAVAVPQYKKAVLKSRFSTLMPLAQSVAKGNEVYYLANGEYADRKDKLDVEGPGTNPEGTQVNVVESDDYNYVIASRNSLPNKYIVYQAHSPKFAGNVHCEAEDGNTTAMELCKSLGGQEIGGSQTDGYVTYVLEGTYGEEDKLPTSLAKLAANLCDGKSNCESHVEGNTVITQECTGNMSSNAGQTCINKTYNDEGTQVDYERTQKKCKSGGSYPNFNITCSTDTFDEQNTKKSTDTTSCYTYYATWDGGICIPTGNDSGFPGYYSQTTTEGNRLIEEHYYCSQYENGVCGVNGKVVGESVNDKNVSSKYIYCNGTINANNTCNDGAWNRTTDITYDEQGRQQSYVSCQNFSSQGACIAPSPNSFWYQYDEDGTTPIRSVTPTYDYGQQHVIFITTDVASNKEIGRVMCVPEKADWNIGTCNE